MIKEDGNKSSANVLSLSEFPAVAEDVWDDKQDETKLYLEQKDLALNQFSEWNQHYLKAGVISFLDFFLIFFYFYIHSRVSARIAKLAWRRLFSKDLS